MQCGSDEQETLNVFITSSCKKDRVAQQHRKVSMKGHKRSRITYDTAVWDSSEGTFMCDRTVQELDSGIDQLNNAEGIDIEDEFNAIRLSWSAH